MTGMTAAQKHTYSGWSEEPNVTQVLVRVEQLQHKAERLDVDRQSREHFSHAASSTSRLLTKLACVAWLITAC